MNIETLHQDLDAVPTTKEQGVLLMDYLRQCIEQLPVSDEERRELAYGIAGLLSTQYISSLPVHHPLEEILTLAGELELPEQNRSHDATWEMMAKRIRAL